MKALASPAGYNLSARYDTRIPYPKLDDIYTRAAQWRVQITRRKPTP
jgi:hypothetical protein